MLARDLSLRQLLDLRGRPVYARNGEKIGRLDYVVYDEETGRPEWIAVRRGFLWRHTTLAPAGGLGHREDGLRLSYPAALVRSAPALRRRKDEDARTPLYRHYRLECPWAAGTPHPGTELAAAGAVTVRKWVEKRKVRQTANMHRETLRIRRLPVYEPVEDGRIEPQEVVITLYDEHPAVTTRLVARERLIAEKQPQETNGPSAYRRPDHPGLEMGDFDCKNFAGQRNGNRETA